MMDIRTYLSLGKPLLFDGAMGTWFVSQPGQSADQCERANLDQPEKILDIHRAYLDAGCRAIKTNTFSIGNYFTMENNTLGTQLIQAACLLAKKAAAPYHAFVFGDIGPVSEGGGVSPAELYCRQADLFLSQGITCFLIETLSSDEGIAALARHLKESAPGSFLIVSFAVGADGITGEGLSGRELFQKTAALPDVDAVGFNCMSGPHHLLEFIRSLNLGTTTLSVMPNAGYPTVLGRKTVYQGQPDYFAGQLAQIVQAGASIVGGCCGTTPAHIAALATELSRPQSTAPSFTPPTTPPRPDRCARNTLWEKLDAGKRVIAVELDPPIDDGIAPFLNNVTRLHTAGVDVITIADCPIGRPRADSSVLACKLKRELGIEPLPHMTCRDRNLNATKSLLLGLSMEGIHNVLLVTGDPIPTADRAEVKSVFNFNSRKLARYVSDLNETVLQTPFRIFGALNLNAHNFAIQLKIAQEKEANGVSAFLTQPILSKEALENLKLARKTLHGKILGGIFPVVSYRNACFLNNEISGIRVCDEIVRLYEGKSKEAGEELAIGISKNIIKEITPYTDGIYFMTPFRRVELIARIIKGIE